MTENLPHVSIPALASSKAVFSPPLFNLFIADLPSIFHESCDPVTLHNRILSCLMYADDLVLLSESEKGLQNSLDKLKAYSKKWNLTVNLKKSQVIVFNKAGHLLSKFKFKYGMKRLETVVNIPTSALSLLHLGPLLKC